MAESDDPEIPQVKPVHWVGSSRKDLKKFSKGSRQAVGQALFNAQIGKQYSNAKPLKGFGGAGVLEVVEDDDGNTYRAVYTVKFVGVVYVLHAFQKKSKRGAKTPHEEIEKIRARLRVAENDYAKWSKDEEQADSDRG